MKKILFAWLWLPLAAMAHEGHGDQPEPKSSAGQHYFTTEASSDKYELLLKYEPLQPGTSGQLYLYVSEFTSNRAIDSAVITVSSPGISNSGFTVQQTDKGEYLVTGVFPEAKHYSLNVKINALAGADLLMLPDITVGEDLPEAVKDEHENGIPQWALFSGGLLAGALLVLLFIRLRGKKVRCAFGGAYSFAAGHAFRKRSVDCP